MATTLWSLIAFHFNLVIRGYYDGPVPLHFEWYIATQYKESLLQYSNKQR